MAEGHRSRLARMEASQSLSAHRLPFWLDFWLGCQNWQAISSSLPLCKPFGFLRLLSSCSDSDSNCHQLSNAELSRELVAYHWIQSSPVQLSSAQLRSAWTASQLIGIAVESSHARSTRRMKAEDASKMKARPEMSRPHSHTG